MTKLEELRTAYEEATGGEYVVSTPQVMPRSRWVGTGPQGVLGVCQVFGDSETQSDATAQFIALAHNLMPALLEAVEALEKMGTSFEDLLNGYPERELHEPYQMTLNRAAEVLEKLK